MAYGPELISNGDAEQILTDWTAVNVTVSGPIGDKLFELSPSASMTQEFDTIQFTIGTEEKFYLLSLLVQYTLPTNPLLAAISAQARLVIDYGDLTHDVYAFPLRTEDLLAVEHQSSLWYQLEEQVKVRSDAVVIGATLSIESHSELVGELYVDNISVRRSETDLEGHMSDIHPHDLPLAISIGNFGILATKGEDTQFWLKDTGDALFAGELVAASGSFAGDISAASGNFSGTVFAENISTLNAKIAVAQIDNLIVGDNVVLGPNALITWGQVTDTPDLVTATELDTALTDYVTGTELQAYETTSDANLKLANLLLSSNLGTVLGEDFIVTGSLAASQIVTGQLAAARIDTDGLYAERIYDPDAGGNYMELGGINNLLNLRLVRVGTGTIFSIEDNGAGWSMQGYDRDVLTYNDISAKTYAQGAWDFSGANVAGISSLSTGGDIRIDAGDDIDLDANDDIRLSCGGIATINGERITTPYFSGNYCHVDAGGSALVIRDANGSELDTITYD